MSRRKFQHLKIVVEAVVQIDEDGDGGADDFATLDTIAACLRRGAWVHITVREDMEWGSRRVAKLLSEKTDQHEVGPGFFNLDANGNDIPKDCT